MVSEYSKGINLMPGNTHEEWSRQKSKFKKKSYIDFSLDFLKYYNFIIMLLLIKIIIAINIM